ncbi:hypothetical protein [Sediminivirga luteola]|uniref:hypothetical protein n=1 Tax=Sediminivirga luteola TaxID=1774748 RepID=UPI001F567054|nr:hypothetical protein [Sediminivirga luteola]MCI2265606.1 hypothetical protein [Sediminivirga luteola]
MNFWEHDAYGSWALDAFVLTGAADVNEVLEWVEANRAGRRVEVFVEADDEPVKPFGEPRTSELLRLLGSNPNEEEEEGPTITFVRDTDVE